MAIHLLFFIGTILLNAAKDIEMLKRPTSQMLMQGKKLELQWNYNVKETTGNQWKIGVYVRNTTTKAKERLITRTKSGTVELRPLPHAYEHIHAEIFHNSTKLSISSTSFKDTASYGFFFQKRQGEKLLGDFEAAVDVTIVGK